ncbi:MAG: glycoside hydrolase family 43 protein [Lachnospiraceae bacterium]|nr:glycoside hydrolase family 43 protein [Lachnospiraceae bacterium]
MLRVSEDEYYLYCTSAGDGFYCWRSQDMVSWSDKQMCYRRPEDAWSVDRYWAPEVVAFDGKYYLFYTAGNREGSLRIGLAIADRPGGPFIDFENRPLLDLGYATIDANVLLDDDGRNYMYFSRDCSENLVNYRHVSQIYGIELSSDLKSVKGEPVLLTTPEQEWELKSGKYRWNEGPEMIKHDGRYYLSYSANYYGGSAYSIGYAVSDSPLGEFKKAEENPILTSGKKKDVSGTGHHGFVMSPDKTELWVSYHSHTNVVAGGGDRKVNICRAGFTADGKLYMNGPFTTAQGLPSGAHPTGTDFRGRNVTSGFRSFLKTEGGKLSELKALIDGRMSVHPTDGDLDVLIPMSKDGEARVLFRADAPTKVDELVIYTGLNGVTPDVSMRVLLDGKAVNGRFFFESQEGGINPVILSFEGREVTSVELIFGGQGAASRILLSEIGIYGTESIAH